MRFILRPVAYGLWLLALGVSIALAWQFHGGDNMVALSIALLALGLSAFGVIFARDAIHRRDGFSAFCGVILWATGAVFFAIVEIGFWDSAYSRHYTDYQTVKTAKVRADALNDKKWDALTTGQLPEMPAQIQAKIDASKMSERWTATKQCADVTTAPSREFCRSYFQLHEKLAEAEQRITLEAQFSKGVAEKEGHIVHNLLAGAEVLNRRLDLNDNRLAADIVIFAAWALLFLARDLGGVVANPLGRSPRPQEATGAAKSDPVALAGSRLDPQPVALPRTPMAHLETIAGVYVRKDIGQNGGIAATVSDKLAPNAVSVPTPGTESAVNTSLEHVKKIEKTEHVSPEPDGPGTPAPAPKPEPEPKFEDVLTDNVIDATNAFRDTNPKAAWKIDSKAEKRERRKKAKKERKNPGEVKDFIRECLVLDKGSTEELTGDQIHDAYSDWCDGYGYGILGKGSVSGAVARHFQLPHCREPGARGKHGRKFPGISFKRQQLRKTA